VERRDVYDAARKVYVAELKAISQWQQEGLGHVGCAWTWSRFYKTAHGWCYDIAAKHDSDVDTVAKVLAVTSPLKAWHQNMSITERIISGESVWTMPLTKNRKMVASLVLHGGPMPESGIKTWNFYHNIVDPYGVDHVTIDRHMIRPVLGRVSCSRLEYEALAEAVKAAARLGWRDWGAVPSELQATLWGWYRTNKGTKI
jgi:hypothetical protein